MQGSFTVRAIMRQTLSHHLTENSERRNYAFVYVFRGNESAVGGVADRTPEKVISVRDQVQGIVVYDGGIILSTSYGLPDSHLYRYENILSGEGSGTVTINGSEVPLYRLDGSNLKNTLTLPCMSEEICISDGRVYILFESLSNKYKYFVRTRTDCIMSVALNDM